MVDFGGLYRGVGRRDGNSGLTPGIPNNLNTKSICNLKQL